MVCIYCGSATQTINSRAKKKHSVWRRRKCVNCDAVFTTSERPDWEHTLIFQASPKSLQPFSRDKLLLSLNDSLKHRNDATEAATALTDTILQRMIPKISSATVLRNDLIVIATEVLHRFDKSAAVAYTAFHPIKTTS